MVFCCILDWHQLTWWNPAMLRETRRGRCHRGIRSSLSPLGGLIFLAASLRGFNLGYFGHKPCLSPIPKPLQILS